MVRLCFGLVAPILLLGQANPSDLDRVRVGDKPPSFTLASPDGSQKSLSTYRGKNLVLVFYRGHW